MSEYESHVDTYLLQILERLDKIEGRLSSIERAVSRLNSKARKSEAKSGESERIPNSATAPKTAPVPDGSEDEEVIDAEPIEDEPETAKEDRGPSGKPSQNSSEKPRIIIEDEPPETVKSATTSEDTATLEEEAEAKRREAEKLQKELFDLELDAKFRDLKSK